MIRNARALRNGPKFNAHSIELCHTFFDRPRPLFVLARDLRFVLLFDRANLIENFFAVHRAGLCNSGNTFVRRGLRSGYELKLNRFS